MLQEHVNSRALCVCIVYGQCYPWLGVELLKFSRINFPVLWLLHFNVAAPKQTKSCFWEAKTG